MSIDPDLDRLLRSTDDAFRATLHAVLDHDRHAAREVLRGSEGRRLVLASTRDSLRGQPWVPAPQIELELQLVSDIGRIGDVVDHLARHLIAGGERRRLSPAQRMEVAVLLDAGGRWLRQLADGPLGGGLDPSYRGTGAALFEVADHGARDRSATVILCAALAVLLLQATRHAARAA